jgi:hypothetical protein
MTVNKSFRNYATSKWLKSENSQQEQSFQASVEYMGAPIALVFGILFFMYGIWLLDMNSGVLNQFPFVRAIKNFVIQ